MITKTDLLLLTRVGKILGAEADTIKQSNAPWDGSAESREQKRRYDRMLREQRDLADLRARLAPHLLERQTALAVALANVVRVSDEFVADTGLKHGDPLTDAVDAARVVLGGDGGGA